MGEEGKAGNMKKVLSPEEVAERYAGEINKTTQKLAKGETLLHTRIGEIVMDILSRRQTVTKLSLEAELVHRLSQTARGRAPDFKGIDMECPFIQVTPDAVRNLPDTLPVEKATP